MKRSEMSILLKAEVYARHGRELMGCKSPVCESGKCVEHINQNTSRRQGHCREVLSEGSPSANL